MIEKQANIGWGILWRGPNSEIAAFNLGARGYFWSPGHEDRQIRAQRFQAMADVAERHVSFRGACVDPKQLSRGARGPLQAAVL